VLLHGGMSESSWLSFLFSRIGDEGTRVSLSMTLSSTYTNLISTNNLIYLY
jgi:hypothetical protein